MSPTAQIAAALARRFEGLCLTPYLCLAGRPTVGYGATYYEDGTKVSLLDPPITKERAENLLVWTVDNVYLPAVQALCPNVTDPKRQAALIDFAFNLGAGRLKASNLRRRVNAQDWVNVPGEIKKWDMAAGHKLKGLTTRRNAEADLI